MSDCPTLQVGEVELRKTADGWQYLSEGVQGEPDCWCDATSMLGPFSHSGVGSLLDELLVARETAATKTKRVCQTCRWWDSGGNCDFIDTIQGEAVASTTGCQIIAHVHDDYGLQTALKTGPNYSCPSFTPLTPSAAPAPAPSNV
ncbi:MULTISPECIES: hypothetical protein [Pseudomonas]|uniref:hypothetical protein n=1 Tax=Pseudomonas TaxID=286 RepID=UPI000ACF1BA0|nr:MULTISPECIES: hypothetical protein [Pseudomonas]WHS57381.1 hypothetical protein QLH64_30655 [Pseudomonas brassicacearum]